MPAPISGTVVAAGSAVSPGGDTGLTGPAGSPPINSFFSLTAAYTFTSTDSGKYAICSGGSWTLTLPVPVLGMTYTVRNDQGITGTTGTITLQPSSGTIDGLASLPLLPGQECRIITDGTNWRTFGLKREVILGTLDITSAAAAAILQLPVGYRYFEIQMTGYIPATSGDYLRCQFSTDSGNTWLTAATYYTGVLYNASATTAGYSDLETSTFLHFAVGEAAVGGLCGNAFARIYPGSVGPNLYPSILNISGARGASYNNSWSGYGFWNAAVIVNAIKIFTNSGGNITSAYFTVKGVV